MGDHVKSGILIAAEMVVTSVILLVIVYASTMSNTMVKENKYREQVTADMRAFQDIANYNNKEVTGDELIIAAKKFAQTQNMCVVRPSEDPNVPSFFHVLTLRETDPLEKWSEKEVRKSLQISQTTNLVQERFRVLFYMGSEEQRKQFERMYPSCQEGDMIFQKL